MDINRFTEKSREALTTAQGLAAQYGHQEVDAEHLALALVNQEDGFVPRVLERVGVAPKALVTALEAVLKKRPSVRGPGAEMGTITISQRVAKAIANAEALAKRLRDEYVSVEHIFAELLREPASTGLGQVAAGAGLSADKFTETMMAVRGPHRVTSANPEESYEALSKYGRNLVEAASKGKLDPVIGRDAEIRRVIRILSRRTKNNPVLIGEAGVGKTAIAELEHGGSPEHAVRTAFVYQINKYLKEKNLYRKGESAISFQDVQDCLVYVSSSFSTRTSYENQTKKAITNKFVSQAMTDFLKHYLEVYFLEKPEEAQKICQQVLVNKQSREHAEKTRQSIKKTLSTQIDLANRVQKFVDCRTRDSARRELYIVEGDSAMGAVKSSRDSEYQAIMPIRGKILNCLKADYARIFKSDVIVDLIKVMGCGVELGGKHNKELATFNLDNLRFNKIVICTDADVDGYQIRTLVLTMLYRLTPTLINNQLHWKHHF